MSSLPNSITYVSIRHFDGHFWDGIWCPDKWIITDGFDDWWVHGTRFGDDLRVFLRGIDMPLDRDTPDHKAAIDWCVRQFGDNVILMEEVA
jgi:hypothetical protein